MSIPVCLLVFSCNNNEAEQLIDGKSTVAFYNLDGHNVPLNPFEVRKHVINQENDMDAIKIDNYRIDLAEDLTSYFITNEFNSIIEKQTNWNVNSCTPITEFLSNATAATDQQRQSKAQVLEKLQTMDFTHMPLAPDKNEGLETYIPAIHFYNVDNENVNLGKAPIFSAGTQVNVTLEGMSKYEDYIIAWIYDQEKGEKIEFLLSEEVANELDRPLFLVDNAHTKLIKEEKKKDLKAKPTEEYDIIDVIKAHYGVTQQMEDMNIYTDDFQINYRYEGSGVSNFAITAYAFHPMFSGDYPYPIGGYSYELTLNNANDETIVIKNVEPGQIGQSISQFSFFSKKVPIPFQYGAFAWNTFERDWAASRKPLGLYGQNFVDQLINGRPVNSVTLYGRMGYSSEWYGYNPGIYLAIDVLDVPTIFYSWSKTYTNNKGFLRFRRG